MDKIAFTNLVNITIDEFLNRYHISKTILYKIKQNNLLTVNDEVMSYDYKLKKADVVTIIVDEFEKNTTKPWEYSINIIHEDKDVLIINKPIGILIHSDGTDEHTLENAVSYYYQKQNINRQVRNCHRLDFDTSGVIVFAKHFLAHSFINYQIENKLFKKTYYAIINGKLEPEEGIISLNIGRDRHNSNKYIVSRTGKEAITKYKTIKKQGGKSLLEITLETGRTHQIRVHLSHLKHPLIGDKIYGNKADRMMLHAAKVSFIHPRSFKEVLYESKTPKDFKI